MKYVGLLILVLFYSVYLGKMLLQKHRGIQTDQIARGKRGRVFYIELVMKLATYGAVLAEVLCIFTVKPCLPLGFRIAGAVLGFAGDAVFALAVITMKDSWRAGIAEKDQTEMVTNGIYRLSRNPAFLGFDLVYAGMVLMFFHWALLAVSAFAGVMLYLQILQEERFLATTFGPPYLDYKKQVRRYLGRSKGRDIA